MIKIWQKVAIFFPKAKLYIIGGGSDNFKNELLKDIQASNLQENIDLLGYLEKSNAVSLLKSAKIFLFPSHEEGWGIAIAEAMAAKLPVICWDLPAYNHVFGSCLIQVRENDLGSFVHQTVKLLKDNDTRRDIAERGYIFIQRYSWEKVAENEFGVFLAKNGY